MAKNVKAKASPITVYRIGEDQTQCNPFLRSMSIAVLGVSEMAGRLLIKTRNRMPDAYKIALTKRAVPRSNSSITKPDNAGPIICPD